MVRIRLIVLLGALLLLVFAVPARGQTSRSYLDDPFARELEMISEAAPVLAAQLRFRLVAEVFLPGPLPGEGPRVDGREAEIAVAGGVASVPLFGAAEAEIAAGRSTPRTEGERWAVSPDGRRRYGTAEDGFLVSEKRCKRCERGWKRRWRHRIPGNRDAPPLLHENRLYVAAMDNLIYCMKAGNGYQLWTSDVGARSSRPLVVWTGGGLGGRAASRSRLVPTVILAIPDSGSELLALDGETGQRVARVEVGRGEGTLVGVPATTEDGRILVAHQKYSESEAALQIYRLDVPGFEQPADPFVPPTAAEPTPSGATDSTGGAPEAAAR
jgi:hypothetical protein